MKQLILLAIFFAIISSAIAQSKAAIRTEINTRIDAMKILQVQNNALDLRIKILQREIDSLTFKEASLFHHPRMREFNPYKWNEQEGNILTWHFERRKDSIFMKVTKCIEVDSIEWTIHLTGAINGKAIKYKQKDEPLYFGDISDKGKFFRQINIKFLQNYFYLEMGKWVMLEIPHSTNIDSLFVQQSLELMKRYAPLDSTITKKLSESTGTATFQDTVSSFIVKIDDERFGTGEWILEKGNFSYKTEDCTSPNVLFVNALKAFFYKKEEQ